MTQIAPHPGPQTRFLSSNADVVVYGGERGGGKTGGLVMDAARGFGFPQYRSVLFRRTYPELVQANGIWQTAAKWYPLLGGVKRESAPMVWRFPSGAECAFSHLQHESDVESHLGAGYDFIGLDQAEGFTSKQIWGLMSCLRTTIPGVKPSMRLTCNPDPDCYLKEFIAWWLGDDGYPIEERDGVIRYMFRRQDDSICWGNSLNEIMPEFRNARADLLKREPNAKPRSVTFIAAGVRDNPSLQEGYLEALMDLPAVERERYLGRSDRRGGNWKIRPAPGNVFRLREWCRFVDAPDVEIVTRVRGWDLAGTEPTKANRDPDWTRCLKWGRDRLKGLWLLHGDGWRLSPGATRDKIKAYAASDEPGTVQALWQDPAQAGKDQADQLMRELEAVSCRFRSESKTKHTGLAGAIASQAEHGRIGIVRGPWVDSLISECDQFPDGKHDDWIAAMCRGYIEITSSLRTDGYQGIPSERSTGGETLQSGLRPRRPAGARRGVWV